MNSYTALKCIYNRKTKGYDVVVIENADLMLIHSGYLVFDDKTRCEQMIRNGQCIQSWNDAKKTAILNWMSK